MIDGLKPYADRRDSGLLWLGKIPAHWEVRRNGRLFVQRNETGFPDLPILEVSLKTGVRVRDFEGTNRKQVMSDREKYKRARQGDLAYNMMRLWQGAVGTSPVDGLVSPAYVVAKPLPQTDSRYYQYLFRTGAYMDEVNKFSRGIVSDRNRLYWEDFKQMPSPFPPPEEQAATVRFLDHADRRIRRYIRAKRQLIALLNEQKRAIINLALTKGFNSKTRMVPSGIDWLGQVPAHWRVKRIKNLMTVVDRRSETGQEVLLSMRKHHGLVPYHEHFTKPPQAADLKNFKLIEKGQIAVNRMQAGFGLIFASAYTGLVSPDFGVFQPTGEVLPEFLGELFRSRIVSAKFQAESKGLGTGKSGFSRLYDDRIGWIHVAYPPALTEQRAILETLTRELGDCNKPISLAESEIALLQEFRNSLIADVVTGKLDVRKAAALLSNELETGEPDAEELLDEDETTDDAELDNEPEDIEA